MKRILILSILLIAFIFLAVSLQSSVQATFNDNCKWECSKWKWGICKDWDLVCPTPSPTPTPTPEPTMIGLCREDSCVQVECDQDECVSECQSDKECLPDPTPTPTPEPTPEPSPDPGPCVTCAKEAPVCADGNTTQPADNAHVIRDGADATVNFFIKEGDSANLYWKLVDATDWEHAVADIHGNSDDYVSYTVHDLDPALGYTFGIQTKYGCGGGPITSVIIDGPAPKLFRVDYYIW